MTGVGCAPATLVTRTSARMRMRENTISDPGLVNGALGQGRHGFGEAFERQVEHREQLADGFYRACRPVLRRIRIEPHALFEVFGDEAEPVEPAHQAGTLRDAPRTRAKELAGGHRSVAH